MPSSFCPQVKEHHRTTPFTLPVDGTFKVVEPVTPVRNIYDKEAVPSSNQTGILTEYGSRIIVLDSPRLSDTITYHDNYIEFFDAQCIAEYEGLSITGKLTGTYNEHNLDTVNLTFVSDTDGPTAA